MDNKNINLSELDELDDQAKADLNEIDKKTRRNVLSKYAETETVKEKPKKKVKPVSFSISFELDAQIDKYCERKYMKKSTFAVLALEEFLRKKIEEEEKTTS